MVYDVYEAVKLPIIGMGGIMSGDDAVEFMLAGASLTAVGMANFNNPLAAVRVLEGIESYMKKYKTEDIGALIGAAH
jgi:dihydroorotate dehydrogenase (NAD+) catalytic subunit